MGACRGAVDRSKPNPVRPLSAPSRLSRRTFPWKTVVQHGVVIVLAGLVIYLVFPKITEVFASWPRLSTLEPVWFAVAVAAEAIHFMCTFALQRIALRTKAGSPSSRRSWPATPSA